MGGGWPLSFISNSFPFFPSLSYLSLSLSFSSLALPIYTLLPSVVDVSSWALLIFFFQHLILHMFLASQFSSFIHRLTHPSASNYYHHHHHYHYRSSHLHIIILSAKISWSDVELDEEMKQNDFFGVGCTHTGAGKGEGARGKRMRVYPRA